MIDKQNHSLYNPKWLEGNYHLEIAAYYFRQWVNWGMSVHAHNQVEIMYVIHGTCSVETQNTVHKLHKGDFILLDANVPHRLCLENNLPCRMLNVEFTFKEKDSLFSSFKDIVLDNPAVQYLLEAGQPYWLLKDQGDIYAAFRHLIMESDAIDTDHYMVQLLLVQIILKISRLVKDASGDKNNSGSIYVKQAMAYMQQHYDQEIKTGNIASSVNIHEGYLHRIFKAHTGHTVLEYLTEFRLNKAKMLLSQTDIPIVDICSYVGINSRQYFTYLFKKHVGITPADFRKSVVVAGSKI